jgi:hypothetical protein
MEAIRLCLLLNKEHLHSRIQRRFRTNTHQQLSLSTKGYRVSSSLVNIFLQLRLLKILQNNSEALKYKGADKSLARPTSRCILFDGENISFDASLVI